MTKCAGLLCCIFVAAGCRASGPSETPAATASATTESPKAASSPIVETAAAPAATAPAELLYRGDPIHPLCIAELVVGETKPAAQLSTCGADAGAPIVDGASYRYEWPDALPLGRRAFIEYEVVLAREDIFYVRHTFCGGGTGIFSGLTAMSLAGSQLRAEQSIAGGDRCNGGLAETSGKNGLLRYAVHLTPFDIISLVPEGRELKLVAYDHLEASAASCFAIAHYRHNPRAGKSVLVNAAFAEAPVRDQRDWTERYRHQSCFNRTYHRYLGQRLDAEQLRSFVAEFAHDCVGRQ